TGVSGPAGTDLRQALQAFVGRNLTSDVARNIGDVVGQSLSKSLADYQTAGGRLGRLTVGYRTQSAGNGRVGLTVRFQFVQSVEAPTGVLGGVVGGLQTPFGARGGGGPRAETRALVEMMESKLGPVSTVEPVYPPL